MPTPEQQREYKLRQRISERQGQGGAALSLRGQDEAEVLRVLLDAPGEAGILLTNPEFMRTAIARMLIRQIASEKLSARDQRQAASMLIDLLALDKASKVAQVERDIREIQKRLGGEPDTGVVEAELGEKGEG